jgi:hypothetical protein
VGDAVVEVHEPVPEPRHFAQLPCQHDIENARVFEPLGNLPVLRGGTAESLASTWRPRSRRPSSARRR